MTNKTKLLALFFVSSAGCGPAYLYGRTTDLELVPKAPGCTFTVFDTLPDKPFDEIGIFAPKDIGYADVPGGPTPFKEEVQNQVCAQGGDGVVVERDDQGRYIRATIIKFK